MLMPRQSCKKKANITIFSLLVKIQEAVSHGKLILDDTEQWKQALVSEQTVVAHSSVSSSSEF